MYDEACRDSSLVSVLARPLIANYRVGRNSAVKENMIFIRIMPIKAKGDKGQDVPACAYIWSESSLKHTMPTRTNPVMTPISNIIHKMAHTIENGRTNMSKRVGR